MLQVLFRKWLFYGSMRCFMTSKSHFFMDAAIVKTYSKSIIKYFSVLFQRFPSVLNTGKLI